MKLLICTLVLMLVIESALYALFPRIMISVLRELSEKSENELRNTGIFGLVLAICIAIVLRLFGFGL